jgi:hypothetical protein
VHRGKQMRLTRAGAAVCNQKLIIVDDGRRLRHRIPR